MPIPRKSVVFTLLVVLSILSAFASTGAVTAGMLLVWFGAGAWLAVGSPSWPKAALPNFMLVFLAWIVASVWWSQAPYSSWYTALILAALPLSFLAWHLTPDPDKVWRYLKMAFVPAVWVVSVWGVYQVVFLGRPRALGPIADPNVFACLLNLAWFPLLAAFFKPDVAAASRSRLGHLFIGLTLMVVALAFFAAGSRGATFAWLILMPIAFWAFRGLPNFRVNFAISLLIAFASYLIIAAVGQVQLADRVGADYLARDASVSLRLVIWRATAEMFLAHPWLGTGLGTWGEIYPAYRQGTDNSTAGYYTHNDYLQIAQEGGLIGIVLLLLIVFALAGQLRRAIESGKAQSGRTENVGLMLAISAAVLHASVNFIFYLIYINILVGLYAARAWQSDVRVSNAFVMPRLSPLVQRMLILFVVAIPIGQIILHEIGQALLNGQSRTLSLLRKQYPELTPYQIAHVIAAIRPNEYIAQRYILESAVQSLGEVDPRDAPLRRAILSETLERFEALRLQSPNSANLGAEEAQLLLKYEMLMPRGAAVQKARDIAQAALKDDPRHVDAIMALADTYFAEGSKTIGFAVLSNGVSRMIFLRDRLILQAEVLKHLGGSLKDLEKIQVGLRAIRFACKIGDCTENAQIQRVFALRLKKLAVATMPPDDPLAEAALASLFGAEREAVP